MLKYTQKLPLINSRGNYCIQRTQGNESLLLRNELWRSNTQPLSELVKGIPRNDSLDKAHKLRISEHLDQRPVQQVFLSQKKQRERQPSNPKSSHNSRDLLMYRKSIKHLIDIFETQSKEMKSININCYHAPISPQKAQIINDLIIKQGHDRRHRLKALQLKKKLKKGLLRTEGNQPSASPCRSKRKNMTQLNRVLNVNSPYADQRSSKLKASNEKSNNSLLLCPHPIVVPREREQMSPYQRHPLLYAKGEASKQATIAGWRIDKIETSYPH